MYLWCRAYENQCIVRLSNRSTAWSLKVCDIRYMDPFYTESWKSLTEKNTRRQRGIVRHFQYKYVLKDCMLTDRF